MADIDVFFASNRNRLPDQDGQADFGSQAGPSAQGIAFGIATVTGVDLDHPKSGTITQVQVMSYGNIGPELAARILANPGHHIVVFVHGAANSFRDSLQRAAFNQNWINDASGRQVVVIVFSWPATSYDVIDIIEDLRDYRHDQAQAQASDIHFVEFLQALYRFQPGIGDRSLTLLAHSMGNYMMGFGIERWFSTPRNAPKLFDHVVLAAADEPSDTFDAPNGARLSDLWELVNRISVYSSRADVLMYASHIANRDWRLGFDGPPNRADTNFFPLAEYEFVDCTGNQDFTDSFLTEPDRTHQYYRQSKSVRADVARVLTGQAAPPGARDYDDKRNVYTVRVPAPAPATGT